MGGGGCHRVKISSGFYPGAWQMSSVLRRWSKMCPEWGNQQVFLSIVCLRMGDAASLCRESCSIMDWVSRWCSGPLGLLKPSTYRQAWTQTHAEYETHASRGRAPAQRCRLFGPQLEKRRAPGRPGNLSGAWAHWAWRPQLTDNVLMSISLRLDSIRHSLEVPEQERRPEFAQEAAIGR